ncbi:MAG: tetratricopeptide repeat protein [Atopobiaceae bacterium]|nr:tetratricopeptide repeat protein [Atopobiaceae bacterium]
MNQQRFETGYAAYQAGDWASAASLLGDAKAPGEVNGRIDHLRGNALMKLGRYDDAAQAYAEALQDTSYGMAGALGTNRGRALLAAGRVQEAADALRRATEDTSYATPYKAYIALGSACRAMGDVRGAGIAYRNAAIDESNPDPSSALRKLGACFMDLGRPSDAVESYRTALDFSTDLRTQSATYCDLALAYVAANRMTEAVDAFDHATADGSMLSPEAQAAYDAARNAVAARSGNRVSDTDDLLAAAGYGEFSDPLDPTGETTGNLMPSPEDTGFFSVTEEELVNNDRRRRRGGAGRVITVILVIVLLLGAACGVAYYLGFGWPTQESVAQELFAKKANGEDVSQLISSNVDDETRQHVESLVPKSTGTSIGGVTRSMNASEVAVTATLEEGASKSYSVHMVRDGIGWKVSSIEEQYASTDGAATATDATDQQKADAQAPAEAAPAEAAPAEQPAPAPEAAPAEQPAPEAAPAEAAPAEANDDATVNNGEITVE